MPERTPSEQLWADLERQLLAMPHEHLAKVCAHLIRTYIIENRGSARATTAPAPLASQEEAASTATGLPSSPPATTRVSQPSPAVHELKRPKNSEDKKYNKLEMD